MELNEESNIDQLREIKLQDYVRQAITALTSDDLITLDEASDEAISKFAHEVLINQPESRIPIDPEDVIIEIKEIRAIPPAVFESTKELAEAALAVITHDGDHPFKKIEEKRVENLVNKWSLRYQVSKDELLEAIKNIIK